MYDPMGRHPGSNQCRRAEQHKGGRADGRRPSFDPDAEAIHDADSDGGQAYPNDKQTDGGHWRAPGRRRADEIYHTLRTADANKHRVSMSTSLTDFTSEPANTLS